MPLTRRTLLFAAAAGPLSVGAGLRAASAPAWADAAGGAPAVIESFYATLLAVMKEGKRTSFDERYKQLDPAIHQTFDLALMTRLAIGPEWSRLPPDQQRQLTDAFTRYTISTYTSRFDDFSGERFEVDPTAAPGANGTIVNSRIIPHDSAPVAINYLMRQEANGWRAMDVFLSGTVSELATRRAEFVAVLQKSGADGLLQLIEQRVTGLKTG